MNTKPKLLLSKLMQSGMTESTGIMARMALGIPQLPELPAGWALSEPTPIIHGEFARIDAPAKECLQETFSLKP